MDVSIVITAFNYGHYIEKCLISCLTQRNVSLDYEVIVVDDGSTDNTSTLLARFNNPRLRIIKIKNSGIEIASNTGFAEAKGRFIVRVDADDLLEPDYLAVMSHAVNNEFGFFYPNYSVIDGNDLTKEYVLLPDFDASEIQTRGDFLATGTLYRTDLLRIHGGYSTDNRNCGLENYELILKFIASGIQGKHISSSLFCYRRHEFNLSATRKEKIINYGRSLCKNYGLDSFRTNEYHPYKLILKEDSL